jgi:hypothetical protein
MNIDSKPTLPQLPPLPEGTRLRVHKFGRKPVSEFVPAPVSGDKGDAAAPRPSFELRWEDPQQGLTVLVRERADGHLIAEVLSTDAGLMNKAAVSVGLIGTLTDHLIRKTIPLGVAEKTGCGGSADFGTLTAAVNALGPRLGVVVILLL